MRDWNDKLDEVFDLAAKKLADGPNAGENIFSLISFKKQVQAMVSKSLNPPKQEDVDKRGVMIQEARTNGLKTVK